MKIKVGLDIGGSTTKIVGMKDGNIIAREIVRAADPVTSAFGAVGKLMNDNSLSVNDIEQINIFDYDEDDLPYYIETEQEKAEYLEELKQRNETVSYTHCSCPDSSGQSRQLSRHGAPHAGDSGNEG